MLTVFLLYNEGEPKTTTGLALQDSESQRKKGARETFSLWIEALRIASLSQSGVAWESPFLRLVRLVAEGENGRRVILADLLFFFPLFFKVESIFLSPLRILYNVL